MALVKRKLGMLLRKAINHKLPCAQDIKLPTEHKKVYEKLFADSVHLLGNVVQV